MHSHDPRRRTALKAGAAASGLMLLPASIRKVLAAPLPVRKGLEAIEHVVILMQENRGFDHYFGTYRGVRGFGDRFPVPLPNGEPVWHQRDAEGSLVLPFHLDTRITSAQRVEGTPHSWPDAQAAWNDGRMDGWVPAKTPRSMGHYRRQDIAFQHALANAFTLCDAYHCSIQAGTNPNRLFHWTGTNDPAGRGGGPAIVNDFDDLGPPTEGWDWLTYPERLQQAGVSWQLYQDMADNFTDNPLEGFRSYRRASAASALAQRALTTKPLQAFIADAHAGRLPQVSWLVAPEKDCEHPGPSSPLQGAAYVAKVLDALAADPAVWARTLLLINYDENDGFFDHMPPPAPPARLQDGRLHGASTVTLTGEYHDHRGGPAHGRRWDDPAFYGRAYGLGPRVPMLVISPWSRGGWVNSQVFDHTSVLRFLERRFGVAEPNISAWRRTVCGDLLSTLDFTTPPAAPARRARLPANVEAEVKLQAQRPKPLPPKTGRMPRQEPGVRHSRALPYALDVDEALQGKALALTFRNAGTAGAVLHLYGGADAALPPQRYTVAAGEHLQAVIPPEDAHRPLQLHGPNGFFRAFAALPLGLQCHFATSASGAVTLAFTNAGDSPIALNLRSHYGCYSPLAFTLAPGAERSLTFDLHPSHHWYDFTLFTATGHVLRRWAGRVETGQHGVTDPG